MYTLNIETPDKKYTLERVWKLIRLSPTSLRVQFIDDSSKIIDSTERTITEILDAFEIQSKQSN